MKQIKIPKEKTQKRGKKDEMIEERNKRKSKRKLGNVRRGKARHSTRTERVKDREEIQRGYRNILS